jgi:hypothetical protein
LQIKQNFSIQKRAAIAILFLFFFFCFVFRNGWYSASDLIVTGVAPGLGSGLVIKWDGGEGLNEYEKEEIIFSVGWPDKRPEHSVLIKRTGRKGGGSLDSSVKLYGIKTDYETDIPSDKLISESAVMSESGMINFMFPGAESRFTVTAKHHIRFEFPTNNYSGSVALTINGKTQIHDLYTTNSENRRRGDEHTRKIDYYILSPDGSFKIKMAIPRYAIKAMIIESSDPNFPIELKTVLMESLYGRTEFPIETGQGNRTILFNLEANRKRFWYPERAIFQILFASITTWLFVSIFRLTQRFAKLKEIFIQEGRYIFWIMMACSLAVFSLWLIAMWPGVMSIDSLKVWRAASLPGVYLNDHPFLNIVLYMYLMHIWNNPAIVPIFQIILTSILGSYIFFSIYRKGVNLPILIFFYLLFILSVPIGLYNLMLWKDIPFALLVTFWGYLIVDMMHQKKRQTLKLTIGNWIAFFLLYISLAFIRHNGILYLLVIPILMMFIGIVTVKQVASGLLIFALVGVSGILFIGSRMNFSESKYFIDTAKSLAIQTRKIPFMQTIKNGASNYFSIFDITQKNAKWDLWHTYLNDRYSYEYLKRVGWNDVYPFQNIKRSFMPWLSQRLMLIYEQTYKSPWVYLTWNPLYILWIFLLAILFFWIFPLSAIFSIFIVVQIAALLFISSLNWRYYYFAFFSSYFLIPLMILDLKFSFGKLKRA